MLAASAGAALVAVTRRLDRAVELAALGLLFVLAFVTVRAMSFHHADALLGTRMLRVRLIWMLEVGGIATVIVGSALRLRRFTGAGESPA